MENKKENFEYCSRIAQELEQYYNGEIMDDETGEQLSLYDYFNDVLDFEFVIDSRLEYKAIKIYVALGGPSVWIDTHTKTIELRWWNENATYHLNNDIVDEIDNIWDEYYNSCR